ncbi:MAG: asparagine synthase-related protein [Candidatus Hodarchaeales archaeon]|jgi:asparagine synthase (glutamine-hydrolysing)
MCGIFGSRGINVEDHFSEIRSILALRGPDYLNQMKYEEITPSLMFIVSQLSLVGTKQFPLISNQNDILIANGEIYNYKELFLKSPFLRFDEDSNDFDFIIEKYSNQKSKNKSFDNIFLNILQEIITDHALIMFDEKNSLLYVSRDCLGIRPLWFYWESADHWCFTSEKKILAKIGIRNEQINQVTPGTFCKIDLKSKSSSLKWVYHGKYLQETLPPSRYHLSKKTLSQEVDVVHDLLFSSVKNLTSNLHKSFKKIGIFLSGGIDSTIIYILSLQKKTNVVPLLIGVDGTKDLLFAKRFLQQENDNNYLEVIITRELIEKNLKTILSRLDSISPVDVGIAIPIYFLSKKAAENKIRVCFTGQGADEIFAGYRRYEDLLIDGRNKNSLNQTLWNELRQIARRNLERDDLMASNHGIELRFPYLDLNLIEYVTKLPMEFLINFSKNNTENRTVERKIILRNLAKKLTIPDYIADRKKTAIQYGSGTHKLLQKLAQEERLSLSSYLQSI